MFRRTGDERRRQVRTKPRLGADGNGVTCSWVRTSDPSMTEGTLSWGTPIGIEPMTLDAGREPPVIASWCGR